MSDDEAFRRHERQQLAIELEQSARCVAIRAEACDLGEKQEELVAGVVEDLLAAAEFVAPDHD